MLACSIVLAGISVKSLISDMIHDMLHVKLKTVRKDRRSRERKGCYDDACLSRGRENPT
jgi:hypothetical protein